jgi:hypothetical protein
MRAPAKPSGTLGARRCATCHDYSAAPEAPSILYAVLSILRRHEQLVHRLPPRPSAPPAESGGHLRGFVAEPWLSHTNWFQIGKALCTTHNARDASIAESYVVTHRHVARRDLRALSADRLHAAGHMRRQDRRDTDRRPAAQSEARRSYRPGSAQSWWTGKSYLRTSRNPPNAGRMRCSGIRERRTTYGP